MFFFGTKKDRNYFLAQKLFGIMAEAAPDGLKEKITLQKDLMRKAKGDDEYSLKFSYKWLYKGKPLLDIGEASFADLPFASVRLRHDDGREFFADFFFDMNGVIFAATFSTFPEDDHFEVVGVDFYPNLLNWAKGGEKNDVSKKPFRISDKLVSILGRDFDEEYVPEEYDDFEFGFEPAPHEELREDWARFVHADLPEEWKEFSRFFSYLEWDEGADSTIFGYGRNLDLILMDDRSAMYLIASFMNEQSSCQESYILASADPSKQGSLYYMPDHDVGAAGLVPIGNDLFGFLRKAGDPEFLKSLEKA